ncbi:MAG: hypothetical protein AABZ67_01435 [Pseudomonadota bacterium]
MPINRTIVLLACLLPVLPARAQDAPPPPSALSDVVYKGVVGKVLDAVPMDPEERVVLQRSSAVVSGTLTGRSLSVLAGLSLSNPILLIAGMAWGVFSATKIDVADARAQPRTKPDSKPVAPLKSIAVIAAIETTDAPATGPTQVALLIGPPPEQAAEAAPRPANSAD